MTRMHVLMSKAGAVAHRLAGELTTASAGDRMSTVQELSERYDVGKGTVQAALGLLEEAGALTIRARRKLGTFIEDIDHGLIWDLAGADAVSIVMPLPYSRRYEGLATGIQAAFHDAGLPSTLMFARGATNRARSVLQERADLAVMSRFAAESDPGLAVVRDFGPNSYVGSHGLVVVRGREPDDPSLRVAVDPDSVDQLALTDARFPDLPAQRRITVSYNVMGRYFAEGIVDATVWNLDEVDTHIDVPIEVHPLPDGEDVATTTAVIAARADAEPLAVGVREAIDSDIIARSAADVVAGRRVPSY